MTSVIGTGGGQRSCGASSELEQGWRGGDPRQGAVHHPRRQRHLEDGR